MGTGQIVSNESIRLFLAPSLSLRTFTGLDLSKLAKQGGIIAIALPIKLIQSKLDFPLNWLTSSLCSDSVVTVQVPSSLTLSP